MADIDKNSIRMILTMAEESNEKWRVNKLCERLELEKYEVSKKVTRLAEKGLIDKSDITDLKLTEAGMAFAVSFSDRLRKVTTHLEYEGMDSEAAARNAFNIAMYCDNDYKAYGIAMFCLCIRSVCCLLATSRSFSVLTFETLLC